MVGPLKITFFAAFLIYLLIILNLAVIYCNAGFLHNKALNYKASGVANLQCFGRRICNFFGSGNSESRHKTMKYQDPFSANGSSTYILCYIFLYYMSKK